MTLHEPAQLLLPVLVTPVVTRRDRRDFVELAYRLNRDDPAWVPPLRSEVYALLDPAKNPWFEHGRVQLFLARRGADVVGRISAHIDTLALQQPAERGFGPGTGNWGLLECTDAAAAAALFSAADAWLRAQGMTRSVGPLSLSIWDEPGLLVAGFDRPPVVMLGHNRCEYADHVAAAGFAPVKRLLNYDVPITDGFPEIVRRIVAVGERNSRIRIRRVDKARFAEEAAIILAILNDAWAENWGFVPLTDHEVAHVGKKLKPLVFGDLIRIAEVDDEPVAFMIVLPNLNQLLISMGGSLWPFNWVRLLWWLRRPQSHVLRVPLMGVVRRLQSSRMASQLAFMMIEYIRRDGVGRYHATTGDIGWVLDDNQGMVAVAEAIGARVNREYLIYAKDL